MKVLPVQNHFSVQESVQKTTHNSFKGAKVDAVVQEIKYTLPETDKQLKGIWGRLFNAIRREPKLQIVNPEYFNYLKSVGADCYGAFFFQYPIENKPNGYKIDLAKDENGSLLSYGKDKDGTFLEISSKEGFRRIGVTLPERSYRYDYYQDADTYIDFESARGSLSDGPRRTIRTKTIGGESTQYCDENGKSTIASNIAGFFRAFFNIFRNN